MKTTTITYIQRFLQKRKQTELVKKLSEQVQVNDGIVEVAEALFNCNEKVCLVYFLSYSARQNKSRELKKLIEEARSIAYAK